MIAFLEFNKNSRIMDCCTVKLSPQSFEWWRALKLYENDLNMLKQIPASFNGDCILGSVKTLTQDNNFQNSTISEPKNGYEIVNQRSCSIFLLSNYIKQKKQLTFAWSWTPFNLLLLLWWLSHFQSLEKVRFGWRPVFSKNWCTS